MTEEQVKQLNAIYEEAIEKLKGIQMEKQEIVKAYIKELEEAKIRALRTSLGLSNNQL
jgi:DNA-binding transcriptional regulator YiaG